MIRGKINKQIAFATGPNRTDDQDAPTQGHGENERTFVARTDPDRWAAGSFGGVSHTSGPMACAEVPSDLDDQ